MKNKEPFAPRLKRTMGEQQINQRQLSKITGLSEGNISRYYNGLISPKISHLTMIAKALHVNPLWLMGMEDEKEEYSSKKEQMYALVDTLSDDQLDKLFIVIDNLILK